MPCGSRSLLLGLIVLATWGLGACGDRASGETSTGGKPAGKATSFCPSVAELSAAAGFEVTFSTSIGVTPDRWIACQYEMTGRYRGNFVELTGQPASKADSVFGDLKRAAKGMKGIDAEADRLDLGSGGWAYGSNSLSEAAAVVGTHVYHARMEYMGFNTIGDQKDAMVAVLKLIAR
ncbi:MAG TPA: hypothetical protein VJQ46_08860 [Gemmatimonadales bacterium]|nr:hypothetical protein [Gemmatimonadales bacterium]